MPSTNTSTTTSAPSVKKYVDYANQQVDEQAILDKYNAATIAQYNVQREQNRQAENDFYNQMYNTQRTAMDTIRQSNAAAVSSGASRGVQAANELSALLGLQSESVASATELAQANRQTAQEETAAVLENVLNAYQQASQERSQLVSQAIESASVDAQESANQIAAMEAETNRLTQQTNTAATLVSAAENGTAQYLATLQQLGYDYSGEASSEGYSSLSSALDGLGTAIGGTGTANTGIFTSTDWNDAGTGASKANLAKTYIQQICNTYGLDYSSFSKDVDSLVKFASGSASWIGGTSGTKSNAAQQSNYKLQQIINNVQNAYLSKLVGD